MTDVGVYNRTSRSDSSSRAIQDPPVLIKRAQTKWPKWVLQLAHRIDLRSCKVAPEVHPFFRALSRNRIDPHEVMMELSYCGHQSPKLDLNALRDLNDFQLYRLYKTLKSNNAIFEILKFYVDELSDLGPGDDRESAFLLTLTRMQSTIDVLWGAVCSLLKAREISVSSDRDKSDEEVKRALKSALSKNYTVVLAEDYAAMEGAFKKTGEADAKTTINLLKDVYKRLGSDERDGTIEGTLIRFMNAGTDTRSRFLSAVLSIVRDLRHPDPKGCFRNAQKELFARSGNGDRFRVEYLHAVELEASTIWAMHDIARQFVSVTDLNKLKEAVKNELRMFKVDKSVAEDFGELANGVVVEGRSAVVREAIREYAAEPTRPRPKTWSP